MPRLFVASGPEGKVDTTFSQRSSEREMTQVSSATLAPFPLSDFPIESQF